VQGVKKIMIDANKIFERTSQSLHRCAAQSIDWLTHTTSKPNNKDKEFNKKKTNEKNKHK
jgi:hypothetical protein